MPSTLTIQVDVASRVLIQPSRWFPVCVIYQNVAHGLSRSVSIFTASRYITFGFSRKRGFYFLRSSKG